MRPISKEWWGIQDRGQSRQEHNCCNIRLGQAPVILCCAVEEIRLAKKDLSQLIYSMRLPKGLLGKYF